MPVTTNTHILVPEFDYLRPTTLDELLSQLAEHGSRARLIAGGTDLLVQMKMERAAPAVLISLAGIDELRRLAADGEGAGLTAGATTTIRSLARSAPVRRHYRALAEACDAFSTVPIMIMGTVGGNLCNGSPAADTAVPLLAFDASLCLASREGRRTLRLGEFFRGPGETALREGELLHSIDLPAAGDATGSAFLKVSRVVADISKVCAAVRIRRDGDHVAECGIALGAVAPTPVRVPGAEATLTGRRFDPELAAAAARAAQEEVAPISDVRSTRAYRRRAARVIVRDALISAWSRAGGRSFE